jgi:hypothetical protein
MNSAERPSAIVGIGLAVRTTPDSKIQAGMVESLERCSDEDDRIAWSLACGLGRVEGARAAVAALVPRKRRGIGVAAACFATGLLGADEATKKILHEVVEEEDATARREASIALALQRDPEVVVRLRAILASKRKDLDRASAAVCLGLVGDDADIDALLAALADKRSSDPLKACVVHGLGRLLDHSEGKRLRSVVAEGRLRGARMDGLDPFADLRGLVE